MKQFTFGKVRTTPSFNLFSSYEEKNGPPSLKQLEPVASQTLKPRETPYEPSGAISPRCCPLTLLGLLHSPFYLDFFK